MLEFLPEKWTRRTVTLPNAGTCTFGGYSEQGANEHNYMDLTERKENSVLKFNGLCSSPGSYAVIT